MCLDEDNIFSALENFHRAKEMFEELGDKETAMLAYDFFAYVMHKVMEYTHARGGYLSFWKTEDLGF